MKKFTKIALIIAGVFVVIGLSFCFAASILGGGIASIARMAKNGELNYDNWHFENGISWQSENGEDMLEMSISDISGENSASTYTDEVKNIKIYADWGNIQIESSDDVSSMQVKVKDIRKDCFFEKLDGDTLTITYEENRVNTGIADAPEIRLLIPERWNIESIEAETNLGNVEVDDMFCQTVKLGTKLGNVEFSGRAEGELTLETAMGNAEAEIEGREEEFNVDLKTELGNASYRGQHHSESGHGEHHGQSAGGHYSHEWDGVHRNICIYSSLGNVDLNFDD